MCSSSDVGLLLRPAGHCGQRLFLPDRSRASFCSPLMGSEVEAAQQEREGIGPLDCLALCKYCLGSRAEKPSGANSSVRVSEEPSWIRPRGAHLVQLPGACQEPRSTQSNRRPSPRCPPLHLALRGSLFLEPMWLHHGLQPGMMDPVQLPCQHPLARSSTEYHTLGEERFFCLP